MRRQAPSGQRQVDDIIANMLRDEIPKVHIKPLAGVGAERINAVASGKDLTHIRGRPSKFGPEVWEFVEWSMLHSSRLPHTEMARLVCERFGQDISPASVCRMRAALEFRRQKRKVVQLLTEVQKRQRVQFATEMLAAMEREHVIIIFSDESRFCLEPDGLGVYVRSGQWKTAYF